MGMFDTINISKNFKLPLPENMGELTVEDFYNSYQTKDLDNGLFVWDLNEDGTLTREELEYVEAEKVCPAVGFKPLLSKKTGNIIHSQKPIKINFYNFIRRDELKNSYWIEYSYNFVEAGNFGIELQKFEVKDDTERKKADKKWKEAYKKRVQMQSTWWYKFYSAIYAKPIRSVFRTYNRIKNKLPNSFRVERFFLFLD